MATCQELMGKVYELGENITNTEQSMPGATKVRSQGKVRDCNTRDFLLEDKRKWERDENFISNSQSQCSAS